MRNAENYHDACKKKDFQIAFARCFQAYNEYCYFADNPKVKSDILNACHGIMTGKREFDERLEERLRSIQRTTDELQRFLAKKIMIMLNHRLSHVH